MGWKEFFKPTLGKFILFIILLLILPIFGWQNFICKPCGEPPAECPPCGEYQFKFSGIIYVIKTILSSEFVYPTFDISIYIVIFYVVISYLLSCFLIKLFSKYKK
ncbi:hypothetical protein J4221_00085 [Candidatus Pacearchaeota archaeon]|nr:hypothetical protein [Candidatus Pacearchaeota archaeon]